MDEKKIEMILRSDLSKGTEAFCEALLQRCLAVLDRGGEVEPLDDETLELLAAAGDLHTQGSKDAVEDSGSEA